MPCRFWRILFLSAAFSLGLPLVEAQALVSIAVTPSTASIARGATTQFTATGTYSDNSTQNLTSTVTWNSSAPGIAAVDPGGLATGISPGTATITAASAGISGSAILTVQAGSVNYVYDDLGRLVGVIDGNGNAATYNYDPVGNILSVTRQTPTQVSIMQFTPGSGPTGTKVTITGTGFSPTVSQNTVQFNGAAAAIDSASANQLVVFVPGGATTGPIGVTNTSGSATSSSSFNVVASNAPTISGFTPSIGLAGTLLTVTGTNFDTNIFNNRLRCNAMLQTVNSVTEQTSLTAKVAPATTSGHIYLSTPQGKAASSQDFFVPFAGYGVADVGFTGRFSFGGTQNVALTANHIGMLLFDAKGGQTVSVQLSGSTFASCRIQLFSPTGVSLATSGCQTGLTWVAGMYLPMDGTYMLGLEPFANSGSINLTLNDVTDVTGSITMDGPPVTVTTTVVGQDARLNFQTNAANQRVVLFADQVTNPSALVTLVKPDGALLGYLPISASDQTFFMDTQTLATVGTYQVWTQHNVGYVGSERFRLASVPPDVAATLTVPAAGTTGPATTVTTVAGQNANMTFNGTAGQQLSFNFTNVTYPGGGCNVALSDPANNQLVSTSCGGGDFYIDTVTLASTGTYTLFINPLGPATGSMTVSINNAADVTGAIAVDGPAVNTGTTVPRQDARLTFTNTTANQRVALRVTNVTNPGAYINLVRPDGTSQTFLVISNTPPNQMFFMDTQVLATTGTYTLWVQHIGANFGNETLQLNSVPPDVTGTLTVPAAGTTGPAITVTTVAGQNANLTFSGTAGQQLSFNFTNVSYPAGGCGVVLSDPANNQLVSTSCGGGDNYTDAVTLASTGTYTLFINPFGPATGSMTVSINNDADVTSTIAVDGPALTTGTTVARQDARLTFTNTTANQPVTLRVTNVTNPSAYIDLVRPDGTSQTFLSINNTPPNQMFFMDTQVLATTGTYTLWIHHIGANFGNETLQLSSVPPDINVPITLGGAPVTVTTVPAQKAKLTFSATPGQQVTVQLTGNTMGSVTVALLAPDGSTLTSVISSAGNFSLPPQNLTATGTYSIAVTPGRGNSGSITVTAAVPQGPAPRPQGSVVDWSNPLAANLVGLFVMNEGSGATDKNLVGGEVANFSGAGVPTWNTADPSVIFQGGGSLNSYLDAGTSLNFDQLTPGKMTIVAKVYVNTLASAGIAEKNDGNSIDSGFAFGWDSMGAMRLLVEQSAGNMTSATAWGVIASGGWAQVAFTWDGTMGGVASASHFFLNGVEQSKASSSNGSGTLGYANATNHPFRIGNSSIFTSGSLNGKMAYLAVYKGRILTAAELTQLDTQLPIDTSDVVGSIVPNGSSVPVTTTAAGQNAQLTFPGNIQQATVQLTGNTMGAVTVSLLAPDGTTVTSSTSSAAGFALSPQVLPVAGNYTIYIRPANAGNITVALTTQGGVGYIPPRPAGSVLDTNNPLATNLAGLFIMNESTGTADTNLVDSQPANFSGSNLPTWNTTDPSVVFNGGGSLASYLNAGTDLTFDQLTPGKMTIVAKVYVNTVAATGIAEKNDGNSVDSGFVFGWDSMGAMKLLVEQSASSMSTATPAGVITPGNWVQVAFTWDGTMGGAASAAHFFLNGVEQSKANANNGSGTIGYANATSHPFRIGTASFFVPGSLNGKMAYLAVYKGRILTTSEMVQFDIQPPIR
jgi:YD repeat-containing protein